MKVFVVTVDKVLVGVFTSVVEAIEVTNEYWKDEPDDEFTGRYNTDPSILNSILEDGYWELGELRVEETNLNKIAQGYISETTFYSLVK